MENVNSLGAYLRSIVRTAGFRNLQPSIRQVLQGSDEESTEEHGHPHHHEDGDHSHRGQEAVTHDSRGSGHLQQSEEEPAQNERTPLIGNGKSHQHDIGRASRDFSPLRSRLVETSQQRVHQLQEQRDECRSQQKSDGQEPLLVTRIHRDDGTVAEVIVGQSTLPQTIFNSSNTLIGVGILSLPLAFRYAGWILGLFMLLTSAIVTKYTAGLLAKCIDVDSSLANFADIAYVAFGSKGRSITSTSITFELLVGNVGLVILFADTMSSLVDGHSLVFWKILYGGIQIPINFLPMRWLGATSFVGIFCNVAIVLIAIIAGSLKAHTPGSLRDVAATYAWPQHWTALPLSFGLIMALWTGHSVFPNIYRDMQDPPKYGGGLRYIFGFVVSPTCSSSLTDRLSTRLLWISSSLS